MRLLHYLPKMFYEILSQMLLFFFSSASVKVQDSKQSSKTEKLRKLIFVVNVSA